MLSKVRDTPAEPLWWGKNQSGMQANEELTGDTLLAVQEEWRAARTDALRHAKNLSDLGLHKQCANRRIETDLWTTVIISATELDNFFHQRCHWAAQPEMRLPAEAMKAAYDASTPQYVAEGEWHLPFLQPDEVDLLDLNTKKKVCVARCARISYLTHDGKRDVAKDLELFNKLTLREDPSDPLHMSPLEHIATPGFSSGNFKGWTQFRTFFEGNPLGVMAPLTAAIEQIALNCQHHVLTGTKELEPLIRRAPVGVVEGDQELVYYRITDVIQGALEQLARYGKI